jgi:glycolate oxidase iron-sulfur subunit
MRRQSAFDASDPPEEKKYLECIHCGLCLPSCPTYLEIGNEMDSPRGRIYLIRMADEGKISITDSFVKHMEACLLCRACETACPSGVQFGSLMEKARGQVARKYKRPLAQKVFRRFILSLFPYPDRVRTMLKLGRFSQRFGLHRLAIHGGLSKSLETMEELLPPPDDVPAETRLPRVTPAQGTPKFRVGLLTGCVQQVLYPQVNAATVRVLTRNGCVVVIPKEQGCCGSLHSHEGALEPAKAFAQKIIDCFEQAKVDYVITNAAGCGSMMKGYAELLKGDPQYAHKAETFAERVRDVLQFLHQIGTNGRLGPLPLKVTYHDACHLVHGQQIRNEPRALLRSIPGLDLVELRESDFCCGSAGTYNLLEPEYGVRFLERKVDNIVATGAEIVATANPGCELQIAMGLRKRNITMKVLHPIELLDMAYQAAMTPRS